MATQTPRLQREYVETGTEPEFTVNHTTYESAPGGNMRGFVWKLIHGRYVLQYTFMATSLELVQMGREAMQVGAEAHNMMQWEEFKTEH